MEEKTQEKVLEDKKMECDKDNKDLELYKNENSKIREEVTRCNYKINIFKRKITSFLFLLVSLLYLYKISNNDSNNINKFRGFVGISLLMFSAVIILDIIHASSDNNLKITINNISETINSIGLYLACTIIIYTNYSDFKNIPLDFITLIKSDKDNLSKYSLIIVIGFIILTTILSYFKNFFSFLK